MGLLTDREMLEHLLTKEQMRLVRVRTAGGFTYRQALRYLLKEGLQVERQRLSDIADWKGSLNDG